MQRWKLTDLPMYESRKSTLSLICSIVGTTSICRQALASGHLDIICASSATFATFSSASITSAFDNSALAPGSRHFR